MSDQKNLDPKNSEDDDFLERLENSLSLEELNQFLKRLENMSREELRESTNEILKKQDPNSQYY